MKLVIHALAVLSSTVFLACNSGPIDLAHQNKELVRLYLEEVVNTGDISRLPEFVSPEYFEVYGNTEHHIGLAGAQEHILGVRRTYKGLHVTVERQVAEGDWVATQITARGTHVGEWLGIEPTGKPVEFTGINLDRVIDGRIVEHGGAANMLGPLLEVGAVKVVGPATGP